MRLASLLQSARGPSSGSASARGLVALPALMLLCIGSIHCDGSSSTSGDTGGSAGAGGAGGSGGAGGGALPTLLGTFGVYDGLTAAPIGGAKVVYGDQTQTTDDQGLVVFSMPAGSAYEVAASPEGFLPCHYFGITGDMDFKSSRYLLSESTISDLAAALGETYDPTKGIVSVNGAGSSFMSLPDPMTVESTASYGFAVVPDNSSPAAFKKGNATIPGQVSTVYLINVEPGPVPLAVTPPDGLSCTVYPSSEPQGAENVVAYANALSSVTVLCQ